jgi:hypothetical protein
MITIFVDQISERLIYTLDFVFGERKLEYSLTNDHLFFEKLEAPKFNYSERHIPNVLTVEPATVLFDEEIIVYDLHSGRFFEEDCLRFGKVSDPLASIFYILSRMEEYTTSFEDEHGRFESKYSVLSRYGWLEKAMCDRWAIDFLRFLTKHDVLKERPVIDKMTIHPTFDIDNAFAYQWKEGTRRWMAMMKDVLSWNKIRMNERSQVLSGARIDPYDTYEYILSIADRGYLVNVFWLLGDYGRYDRNISFRDVRHQRLIRKMNLKTTVGIHPSYRSNSFQFHLSNEKERLEEILRVPIVHSRQHFLRMKIGLTYRQLINIGIQNDYTMGYADHVGFRAGTARPFRWFDLSKNNITELVVHPFVYMDGTLNEYMKLSVEESKKRIDALRKEVEKYGGKFSFIWHNETIGNYAKWEGWKEVLEYTLKLKEHE